LAALPEGLASLLALGDEILAMLTQQPDLKRLPAEKCRREPVDPFAQDGAGDRSRSDLIGLVRFVLPRREIPIIFGGTRKTCSPALSSARSNRPEASDSPQAEVPSRGSELRCAGRRARR